MREEFRVYSFERGELSTRFKPFGSEAEAIKHIEGKDVRDLLGSVTFTIIRVWTSEEKQK